MNKEETVMADYDMHNVLSFSYQNMLEVFEDPSIAVIKKRYGWNKMWYSCLMNPWTWDMANLVNVELSMPFDLVQYLKVAQRLKAIFK